MKYRKLFACCLYCILVFSAAHAQLYKITLDQKINKASLIIEGKVISKRSFWNDAHTIIYTSNTLQVYKLFKGRLITKQIEVLTQGGSVDNKCLVVSDMLQLDKDESGIFFCMENKLNIHSPFTKNILYDVYSSAQGFLRYDLQTNEAYAPFASYKNIQSVLYALIRKGTGNKESVIDNSFNVPENSVVQNGVVSNGTEDAAITSFSPATVHGGAINDTANNRLTITGSGFGNAPSGSCAVKFKDANNDHTNPDYKVPYNSPYIISWKDNAIVVNVPDRAATGKLAVVLQNGTTLTAPADLNVFYSVLDAEFTIGSTDIIKEPRLMNTNSSGGYTYQFSNSTAGGGVDFTTSPAKETFERALATWKEIVGVNFTEGTPTSTQKIADDDINLIVFDNNNTGEDPMADGVLEATYSWFSACSKSTDDIETPQKTGFDILIRNDGVSKGNVSINDGPCFPAAGSYDLEMIILHELGHALNLAHVNEDYEDGNGSYANLNPSALMHYAILDYVDRRSPDVSAYDGALYTSTPQKDTYGNCNLFSSEYTPLASTVSSNDNCPSTFPAATIENNTTEDFDLSHTTSNKLVDPSFEQVTCDGSGTSVTNNAYYAFMNGSNTTLTMNISNYTTIPSALSSCAGQGVRFSIYDVSACPVAQKYPDPVVCGTFNANQNITVNNLQTQHKYLLYFDGIRNTKASYTVQFNADGTSSGNTASVTMFPVPVTSMLNLQIKNATGTKYQYALFDMAGKLLLTGDIAVTQGNQTQQIYLKNISAGMYILKLVDGNGNVVSKQKIIKE